MNNYYDVISRIFGQSNTARRHDRVAMDMAVGRHRTDYKTAPHPGSFSGAIRQHMLKRRLHSGDFNMINRRRRVQPRQMGGPARLSHRNTQPNRGTFGIGQGINR